MKGMNKKSITPDMRCKIETIAGIGKCIVKRFKLMGLAFFTMSLIPYASLF
jgi:hypothetical protein